ncbi:hypothetical protein [Alcaligenes sp. SDU_A2]|uniref:hypothetical protein n=1 Tax=Alcaligenes sp. SDU_A2 TaxID=3136634 RepID=UPI002B66E849|nr:hypothetical protein [Alcaligenes sp.]HRL27862.1 hypothetical protein [Alcaligenes sp.]
MRLLFIVIVLVNIAVLAFGQGFFGTPPSELGREPRQFSQRNQDAVKLGAPQEAANSAP